MNSFFSFFFFFFNWSLQQLGMVSQKCLPKACTPWCKKQHAWQMTDKLGERQSINGWFLCHWVHPVETNCVAIPAEQHRCTMPSSGRPCAWTKLSHGGTDTLHFGPMELKNYHKDQHLISQPLHPLITSNACNSLSWGKKVYIFKSKKQLGHGSNRVRHTHTHLPTKSTFFACSDHADCEFEC